MFGARWTGKSAICLIVLLIAAVFVFWPVDVDRAATRGGGDGLVLLDVGPTTADAPQTLIPDKELIDKQYGKLPMHFEPNVGQTDESVKFVARGHGYSLFLTETEAVLSLRRGAKGDKPASSAVVRMRVEGANATSPSGIDPSEGRSNYLVGNDPTEWRSEVPNFDKVRYSQILPGVDAVYYGNGQQLEYDFIVAPGTDPGSIKLKFDGIEKAEIEDSSGDLILETGAGSIRQLKPIVYQNTGEGRAEIASAYRLEGGKGDHTVSFNLAPYDTSKELIIDPILAYGSYLGGNVFDEGRGIAVDAAGNAYVVGTAASLDFPTTEGVIKPDLLPSANGQTWYDAFVTKVNPTGTAIVFSTYYGGNNSSDTGGGVALDADGNILISGTTMSNDLPTVNAYQSTFGGTDDGFAAKLNPAGSAIIYSTYLGGNNTDLGGRVAVNQATGDAVFTGYASSGNFPTTPGAFKEQLCNSTPGSCNGIFYSGAYLVKLTAAGNAVYSTLFTASIADITLDASDNATFGGSVNSALATTPGAYQPASSGGLDGFIAKLNPAGSALTYATYLGGGTQSDAVKGIVLDADQNIYVTGQTENTGFPTTTGAFDRTFNGNHDGFITKLNPAGSELVFSTFLGGPAKDQPSAIGLGENNEVFVTGETLSLANFPLRNSLNGPTGTIFLTRMNADASALVFSSLLGSGGAYDLAIDAASNAYLTGHTTAGVIITPDAFQTTINNSPVNNGNKDGFVLKIAPSDENAPLYSISGTVTDENYGYNNDYHPVIVTVTGTVSRSVTLPYNGGQFIVGGLPGGGNYTVTVRKIGYLTAPESVTFNNLGANQSADFTILRNREPEGVITSPAYGATYDAPATITIQATASDPDGDPITKVDFVAYSSATGSMPLGTDTSEPYEFTWTGAPVGTWALYAYPTDNKGLRGYSTPVVHVFVVDPAPLSVSFNTPTEGQQFVEGDYVPIGVNVSSSVTQVSIRDQNNEIVAWLNGPPWSTTRRITAVGQHTFTATAQNSQGNTVVSDPVTINVVPINHVINGEVTDSISLTGLPNVVLHLTSTSNPNVSATTTTDSSGNYQFTGLGTTPNDNVTITPQLTGYSFDPVSRNISYLGYIEWNNQNFTGTRESTITVEITSPQQGQSFPAPANINLAATASSVDGTITQVEFLRRNLNGSITSLGIDTEAPYELPQNGLTAGTYNYVARATDTTGSVKDSVQVGIIVTAPPTTIRLQGDITTPGGNWMPGVTVLLTGTVNGNPINQSSVSNYFGAYGFFNLPAGGDYTITPQGTAITFTPPFATFVNQMTNELDVDFQASAANQPPTVQIHSPADGAVFTMPEAITVNASANDVDGTIASLRLTAQGPTFSTTIGQSLGGTLEVLWQPTTPGAYTIWATATDNGGLNATTSIQITVNPPAPVSISGRTVDRNSVAIEGATLELRDYNEQETVVATATSNENGNYTLTDIPTFSNYILRASSSDHSFSPQQRIYFNLNQAQTGIDFTGTLQVQASDFDGDGETDVSVWRPSTGVWYVHRSTDDAYSAYPFGGEAFGDVITPGNFDGDKKIDYAVFREGTWYILNSADGSVLTEQFGIAGDKPVPADFDGDGRTDIAVWRPADGIWYIHRSSDGAHDYRYFGTRGDMPISGDHDGDGLSDLTVWRPSSGIWYTLNSSDGSMNATAFGTNGDMPLAGDFDGDRKSDIAVFRPANGFWYVLQSSNGTVTYRQWGTAGDTPVPGDYDRDGKTDPAVFRDSDRTWYITLSATGQHVVRQFGLSGDVPIPAAYIQ